MEHQLFGNDDVDLAQYSSSEQEPAKDTESIPGTLLGPEGPGESLNLSDCGPMMVLDQNGAVSRGPTPG